MCSTVRMPWPLWPRGFPNTASPDFARRGRVWVFRSACSQARCDPVARIAGRSAERGRERGRGGATARVHGAHLESNFLNPDWNGAQPRTCLRLPFASGADFGGDFGGGDFGGGDFGS